jgi:toxin ParE1/3/4
MTRSIILRPQAERDIAAIFDWYESQQAGLGAQFLSHLREPLEAIAAHPESAPLIYKNIRRAILSKFPYLVFYIVETSQVVVLAVLHSSRNPAVYPRR